MYAGGRGVPKDYKKAVEWWTKSAEQGCGRAQLAPGWMHGAGVGVPKDGSTAYAFFGLAAVTNANAATARDKLADGKHIAQELREKIEKAKSEK